MQDNDDYFDVIPSDMRNEIVSYCDLMSKYNLKFTNKYWYRRFNMKLNIQIVMELYDNNNTELAKCFTNKFLEKLAHYYIFGMSKHHDESGAEFSDIKPIHNNFLTYCTSMYYYCNNKEFYFKKYYKRKYYSEPLRFNVYNNIWLTDEYTNKIYLVDLMTQFSSYPNIDIFDGSTYYDDVIKYTPEYYYVGIQHCHNDEPYKKKHHKVNDDDYFHTSRFIILPKLNNNVMNYYCIRHTCPHPSVNASGESRMMFNSPYTRTVMRKLDALLIYPIKNYLY